MSQPPPEGIPPQPGAMPPAQPGNPAQEPFYSSYGQQPDAGQPTAAPPTYSAPQQQPPQQPTYTPSYGGQPPAPQPAPPPQPGYGAGSPGFGQQGQPAQPGYAAAPPPGQSSFGQPQFGASPTGPGAGGPSHSGGGGGGGKGVVIGAIVGGVVLLALLIFGVTRLFGGSDPDPTATPSDTAVATPDGTDGPMPPSDGPAAGCTNDICTQTALSVSDTHIGEDSNVWTLDGSWNDFDSGDSAALGGGTSSYTSESGSVELTVVGFETVEQAEAYATALVADMGEPTFTADVWDDGSTDRGAGVLMEFISGGTQTIVWYDDLGVVCMVSGPADTFGDSDEGTTWQYYYSLPPI
ncbi:MAG: hypothetical protein ACK5H2_03135 [Beutenbergiaceae bacterium]